MDKLDMLTVVEDSFATYAGMTIQDRAIIDARDGLKPSHRQCMYSMLIRKYTYKKPFVKSQECVGGAMADFYVHGDAACYDLMARLARPYNMRYPLMGFKGQYGHIDKGKPSAARYTDMRLGELGCQLYEGIDENCIDIWFDNYSGTKQFPSVVPSLGFYNIVNGTSGIATSLGSSIPQFNLKEVNEAMIKLLWNPDIDFDEIYCAPDFCTAGTILNASAVKEILRYGGGQAVKNMKFNGKKLGSSCRMRATATYDANENAIFFTEVPFGVYTHTIVEQIVKGINEGVVVGIAKDGIKDLSKNTANLKIILEKGTNVNSMIKTLYKITDLDSCYSINMIMLDNGTYPKLFSWKEALQAHINHEIEMRTKIHQFYLEKIDNRIHIIDGLLIAIANIDEVVDLIRNSDDKDEAKTKLIQRFNFTEMQVDAILKMTLSKLIHLEIGSFKDEKEKLLLEREGHENILNSKELLYKEIENGFRTIINKYGDERRTKLVDFNFVGEDEDAEPIEKKELLIHYTNLGNIYTVESSTLLRTRRGAKGTKVKLAENEVVTQTLRDDNFSSLLVFSNKGQMYHIATDDLPLNAKINVSQLFEFKADEKPTALTTIQRKSEKEYFCFITKYGMIKKTKASEYNIKRGKSLKAINLKDGDEVLKVLFINDENVSLVSNIGNFVRLDTTAITPIGRAAAGVKAISLKENEYVINAVAVPAQSKFVITVSESGITKKMNINDFPQTSRAIRGKKISETKDNDRIISYLILNDESDIIIIVSKKVIKINTSELRELSRGALGVKGVDLKDDEKVVGLVVEEIE